VATTESASAVFHDNVGRSALELVRDFQQRGIDELERRGHRITPALVSILPYIEDGGSTVSAVAAAAGISKQAVGKFVDELERLGYVERQPHPNDGRATIVTFTADGHALVADVVATIRKIERRYAAALGPKDFARLAALLDKLRRAITS
jgi:DNA-binding MarR family transcriptional regulator